MSDSTFQWALIGPGAIAHRFADAVARLDGCRLHAVCGRDAHRTRQFAERWSQPGDAPVLAHTDPAAVMRDPAVDGVYVATPHGQHFEYVLAALRAGKAVLCEKSLVPNEAMGRRLVEAARAHRAFLMEAVWTRFLPAYAEVATWLREGRIGALRGMQSTFCFPAPYDPDSRIFSPALAGGVQHADAALFEGRQLILTPEPDTDPQLVQRATDVWSALGATVLKMRPHNHDAAFAAVSHLPHLLAFAYFQAITEQPTARDLLSLAGLTLLTLMVLQLLHGEGPLQLQPYLAMWLLGMAPPRVDATTVRRWIQRAQARSGRSAN